MMEKYKFIARQTLESIDAGKYKSPSGKMVHINQLLIPTLRHSRLYKPDYAESFVGLNFERTTNPSIYVTNETTLQAAYRLRDENPCVLNFASGTNPGGGFLKGTVAQEESIARASNLYSSLTKFPEFYEENKKHGNSSFYKDYAIYSPDIVIFRDDDCKFLEKPYITSVVTSPAPKRNQIESDINNGLINISDDELELMLKAVFISRLDQVLKIMANHGHRTIVLGAWGCGAFGNDPDMVCRVFKSGLNNNPYFDKIVFAIYADKSENAYKAFEEYFGF